MIQKDGNLQAYNQYSRPTLWDSHEKSYKDRKCSSQPVAYATDYKLLQGNQDVWPMLACSF